MAAQRTAEAVWEGSLVDGNGSGSVPGLSADEFEQMAREGEQSCPVSNAVRNNVQLSLVASLD